VGGEGKLGELIVFGRWIQVLLSLYVLWQVKCREYVGDSDDGWPEFLYIC
jgi:hypothetical protein